MNFKTKTDLEKILNINKKTYDLLATEYEERTKVLEPITKKVINYFEKYITTGKEVMEIGCAVGLALSILRKKGFSVTGIDISPAMVKLAKLRNPKSKIILGDFLQYKFRKKFDGVFSFAFIHLFPKKDAIRIFEKIFKLLKNGGVLYIGTSKSNKSYESWEIKKDYRSKQKRFRRHWTQSEMRKVLTDVGFKILHVYILTDPYKKVWMDFVAQKP